MSIPFDLILIRAAVYRFRLGFYVITLCIAASCSKPAEDDSAYSGVNFSENIRTTPARTAEEERMGFKVPPGFEVTLFASEPDIQKPMNLQFDAKGRMWVTQSFDYPFPADPHKGTDHITILEDTDHDGKADKFTNFIDTLNIPIGLYPMPDGAIAYSIPNVYRYMDQNLDGKADEVKRMFGPFGYTDTHGMVSNFIRGYDGWIHACHGFTNDSRIAGSDGDSIHMVSGNTFRFRLDGSRVEQTTFGQVNPFGLTYDDYGYIYSTDSHSSPLYQLITGGDYPHFGKLEIMAFVPDMKPLVNEATALAGITYYADNQFPTEFQHNLFIGDVVNSRVHRYSYENKGSSPVGKSEDDFIKSKDPWFRPVNIKLGPDGALYVADFYNAIIGHYEVPLAHPLRDKSRGRIWRISYKGNTHPVADISAAKPEELVAMLNHDNLPVRQHAADQLVERIGNDAAPLITAMLENPSSTTYQQVQGLWILQRLHALNSDQLSKSSVSKEEMVRVHVMRILKEEPTSPVAKALALQGMKDASPHVQRAAAEALGQYPELETVVTLLKTLHDTPSTDTHLVYTCRLEIRNILRHEDILKQALAANWSDDEIKWIEGTLVDVYSPTAGTFLANNITDHRLPAGKMGLAYQQIARFAPSSQLSRLVTVVLDDKNKDVDERAAIFKGIRQGLAQQGGKDLPGFKEWASGIATDLLKKYPVSTPPNPNEDLADIVPNLQKQAFDLAGDYKVESLVPVITGFVKDRSALRTDVRVSAFNALLKIQPEPSIALGGKIIMDDSAGIDFRKKVASTLSTNPGKSVNAVLAQIRNVPPDLAVAVSSTLASTKEGKAILYKKVRAGDIANRTLRNPQVQDRLMLNMTADEKKEFDDLTSRLNTVSAERDQLIDERLKSFRSAKLTTVQIDSGAVIFVQNCRVCHSKVSKETIGPPLAGIGKRGDQAIAEKILDPNRNITEAFRNYTIRTKDGKVYSGVFRREVGEIQVYADLTGQEFQIPTRNIAERKASPFTVMPDTFGSTLTQKEFNYLLAHLLEY